MTLKRKLVLVTAGALVLAGTGTAVAAATGHGHAVRGVTANLGFGCHGGGPSDELSAAATHLGITTDALKTDLQSGKTLAQVADATSGKSAAGLIQALVASEKSALDAAGSAGKLTAAQEQTLLTSVQQRVTDLVNGTRPAFPGLGKGFGLGHGFGASDKLSAAATYLGITADALKTDLQSGKTLAQVADVTSGKSATGLVQALVASEKSALDAAVSAGTLTAAQEQTLLTSVQQRVTDLVNGTRPSFPGAGPGKGFGFGHRGGGPGGTNT
jgi:hypothetical protein